MSASEILASVRSFVCHPAKLSRISACKYVSDSNNISSSPIRMKEYQAVVVKLTNHTREDEDTLTDLLNERSRGGWEPALMSQDEQRLTILFQRSAVAEG